MTDYIERDELVSYFKEIATETLRDGSVQCVLGAGVIAHMIVEIKEFPAADVRPVVHGMWENGHCTSCGEDVASCFDIWTNIQRFLYCPYCGSKIEEAEYFWEEGEG